MLFSISTNRLFIEPLKQTDQVFIQKLTNSPGWVQFIGQRNVHSSAQAEAYIQKIISSSQIIYWVVRDLAKNTPLGIITFIKRDYLDHHDIGFAFLPEFEKQGFAFEASKAVLDKIAETRIHKVIQASTLTDNIKSIQLLKKLGFNFEKEILNPADQKKLQVYQKSLK